MNKIFKVIWSKSKQCYVVVSEMAKNTTGKKKIVVASILATLMAGQVMQVEAAYGKIASSNGTGSLAISGAGGTGATASTDDAIAVGQEASATGRGGIAVGRKSNAVHNALSIGWIASATTKGAIAIGSALEEPGVSGEKEVVSDGFYSIAIGGASQSSGTTSIALGVKSSATNESATAIGKSSNASGVGAFAAGLQTNASGAGSVAIGGATSDTASNGATASGAASIAMGYKSNASSQNAVSIGSESKASELNALAIGTNTNVTKQNATAVGSGASVTGHNATAVGNDTKAINQYDNAFGYTSTASGGAATAVGYYATASGNQTVALGSTINSTAQYATGIGYSVNSQGEGSVAIGAGTDVLGAIPAKQVKATAKNAIAIGRATQATSQDATAIGTEATASNTDAIAIGRKSNASGSTSIGFGYNTKATQTNTVAIGTDVSATAESAIALGRKTIASGLSSTAVGPLANASGKYSSAFGMNTSAANEGSLALGNGASATVDNGVALGSGSKANVGSGTAGFDPHASRNDPYTNLSGNTLTSTWGAVAVGDGTNTRQITGVAAGTNDTDAVNVAQLKALNLAFTTDGNAGDVNLTNTLSVNGDTDYIATSGSTGKLTISGKIKDISVDTNGTASASKGLANAANVATAINDANAAQTIKYKANGAGNNSVKLSDGLNFTNGTTTTATVGANGQVSFDLNTATKQSITDSATAVSRTISLGGDTGSTTAKSLSSGNVNFGVKSGNSTYLTTTANGNDVTLTINEQAIKDAAKDASSFKVKANATAAQDVKGGDTVAFNNGDNIAVTQNGKTFTIGTSKNVTFDTATIGGNTTIGSTGITTNKVTVGTISIDGTNGINAGNKAITNVGTGIVANSNADNSNVANIGDVKTIANDAIANLSTNLGVTDGTNNGTVNLKTEKLKVVGTGAAKATVNGQTITVDVAKGTLAANAATGALTGTAGVVDANDMATAVNTAITKAVDNATGNQALKIGGDTAATGSVNLKSDTLSVKGDNKFIKTAASGNDITLTVDEQAIKTAAKDAASFKVKANSEAEQEVKGGETVTFNNGDNIEITQTGKTFAIATAKNVTFDTATIGGNTTIGSTGITTNKVTVGGISIDGTNGINAGGKQITNVASGGTTATNAANIGDINTAISSLTTNLGKNTTIAYKANNAGGQTVSLADGFNFTNGTLTTAEVAANGVVKFNVTQGTLSTDGNGNITNTAGVATTDDVKNAVNTAINTAVTKATGAQVLNITDGNNNGSINLKNDALKVVGTDGVTTEVSGKTITVGLDTATKDKINNASVATNKNISLAADTGTASSQSLKNGDVSFAVKGATGDYISTNMNGSTVEISTKRATINSNAATGEASVTGNDGLATAKNVADAINAATAKAVSQSAWKLAADGTTGTETISGGDTVNFKAGSNMEVSRTGKDITYKTKDNVAFTTVTAGTGANEVKLDGNTGTVTAKDITATGDVTAKNVTTSGNVTAAGTVKGDTVQGNTVKAGNVTITGGTTNTITGLSNTTWTPAGGIQADRAATEGQLQQAINQVNNTVGNTALTFKGDTNPAQSMTLQSNTFAITGDTMIKTTTNTNGIGLALDTSKVNIAYAANGVNGQTTSLTSGFNFTDGNHTKATVGASGVVKYDAKTSTISVANGHATASGNDLATADNVADAINQMTQNNAGNTTQLRQEISKVATETQRVGAHAAAMAALKPIQYDPLEPTQVMAGVGNYHGETAAALGLAHYTNENTMFNVGVSLGGNHNMVNAGVTHKFGSSPEKKNIPDRYKAGPISSIYVMQDEMTQLRTENESYKAKLDQQQSEIDALKAAVDKLLAAKA